jgi:TRAP transporter TAXI family solute receptor
MKTFISAVLAATCLAGASAASAQSLKLMTGPQGGIWVPLGGQLKDIWEKAIPGLSVQALPGAGVANAKGIETGKADIGFGNTITTADAVKGNKPFEKPYASLCSIGTLYPQYFQVIVMADSGINAIKDIKGKALTTQPKGNTGEMITQNMLAVAGLSYSDVKASFVSYTDSATQMKDNQAQMFTLGTGIPAASVMDIAAGRDIKLIDMGDMIAGMKKINPGYTLLDVPAGTYPKQDKVVKVIGYATHLAVSCKLPEDMVYKMTKALFENLDQMVAAHGAAKAIKLENAAKAPPAPLHPGAEKYYREKGLIK